MSHYLIPGPADIFGLMAKLISVACGMARRTALAQVMSWCLSGKHRPLMEARDCRTLKGGGGGRVLSRFLYYPDMPSTISWWKQRSVF